MDGISLILLGVGFFTLIVLLLVGHGGLLGAGLVNAADDSGRRGAVEAKVAWAEAPESLWARQKRAVLPPCRQDGK